MTGQPSRGQSSKTFLRSAGDFLRRHRPFWAIFLLLAAIAVLYWLFEQKFVAIADKLQPYWLVFAFLSYIAATIARTARFAFLVPLPITKLAMFRVTAFYQMWRSTAPAQSGELSYPLLLNKAAGVSKGEGLGQLVLVRLADMAALSSILVIGALWHFAGAAMPVGQVIAAAMIALIAIVAVFVAGNLLQAFHRIIPKVFGGSRFQGHADKISKFVANIQRAFTQVGRRELALVVATTIASVALASCRVYGLLMSVGIGPSPGALLFILGATQLLSLVPLRVTAGVGIKEAGFLGLLLLLGYQTGEAIAATAIFAMSSIVFPVMLCAPLLFRSGDLPSMEERRS